MKTKFPEKSKLTIREVYGPAMQITEQEDADQYYAKLVAHCMKNTGKSRDEAETIQKANLGYYAGYYDAETMVRVNRLFRTTHPIFGDTIPSAGEAFSTGKQLGEKLAKNPK